MGEEPALAPQQQKSIPAELLPPDPASWNLPVCGPGDTRNAWQAAVKQGFSAERG